MKRAKDKEPPLPSSPRLRARGPKPLRATVQTLPTSASAHSPFGLGEVSVVGLIIVSVIAHPSDCPQKMRMMTTRKKKRASAPPTPQATVRLAKGARACGSAARDRRASSALACSYYRVWVPPLAARLGRVSHSLSISSDSPMPLRCLVTSQNRAACVLAQVTMSQFFPEVTEAWAAAAVPGVFVPALC